MTTLMFEPKGDGYISLDQGFAVQLPAAGRPARSHPVEITGRIQMPDGSTDHISAQGDAYEDALRPTLEAAMPDGRKLIVIRTDS